MSRSDYPRSSEYPVQGNVLEITGEKDISSALEAIQNRRDKVLRNLAKLNPDASTERLNAHLDHLVTLNSAKDNIRRDIRESGAKPGLLRRAWNAVPGWLKAVGAGVLLFLLFGKTKAGEKEIAQAAQDMGKDIARTTNAVMPTAKLTRPGSATAGGASGKGFEKGPIVPLSSGIDPKEERIVLP